MATGADTTPGIIVPGPELRAKIEKSAASLAKRDKRKAEETMAKVLASPKREEFLFFEMTHIFYPFFLQKLNEYRANPDLIPSDDKKDPATTASKTSTTAATTTTATTATTTTVKDGGIVRKEGGTAVHHDPKREEALRQAELEAQRYLDDPFPNRYGLDLHHGTVDMPALVLNYITVTAQYVAKYGERFLQDVLGRHRNNAAFRFLGSEDVRHEVFLRLVESYRRILQHDSADVEDRLERYQSPRFILETLCEEKVKFARASIARRKAALLTDETLRDKLEWNLFSVVQEFSLGDLGLDGPMPEAAAARRRAGQLASGSASSGSSGGGGGGIYFTINNDTKCDDIVEGNTMNDTGRTDSAISFAEPPTDGPPRMLRPPDGVKVPTFTPTFISNHLVSSTDPTAPLASEIQRGAKRPRGENADTAGRNARQRRDD